MTDDALENPRDRLTRWATTHGPTLRAFLWASIRRHDVADDLLQETLRKAWQNRSSYVECGHERAWLFRIADRLVLDWRRRERRQEQHLIHHATRSGEELIEGAAASAERIDGTPSVCDDAIAREDAARAIASLNHLSEPQRRTLLLRFFGDLEFAEIAKQMELPLGTVLSHAHRGLARLRTLLAENDDPQSSTPKPQSSLPGTPA